VLSKKMVINSHVVLDGDVGYKTIYPDSTSFTLPPSTFVIGTL